MPMIRFTYPEICAVLRLAEESLSAGSPLPQPAPNGTPVVGAEELVESGAVVRDGGELRLNLQLRAVLRVLADPDEIMDLTITGERQGGLTVCRRGESLVQCNVAPDKSVLIAFPVQRENFLAAVMASLSGDRPLPDPLGVWFDISLSGAFILGTLIRAFGREPHRMGDAHNAIQDALEDTAMVLPYFLSAGQEEAFRLRDKPTAILDEITTLVAKNLIVQSGSRISVRAEVVELLSASAIGAMLFQRADLRKPGLSSLNILRLGDRLVLTYVRPDNNGKPLQHWEEVDRETARMAAVSLFLDPAEIPACAQKGTGHSCQKTESQEQGTPQ